MSSARARRRSFPFFRRAIAVLASLSIAASMMTATSPPARAADPGVGEILGTVGKLATWTEGLGSVGKLGEQLPLVAASPGGLLGFTDLFSKAVAEELAGANSFGDLNINDKDIAIGNGRTGKLTTSVSDDGDGKRLDIAVRINRTVAGQDLHLASSSPKVDLTVSDGITLDLKSRLALSLVWTGEDDNSVYVVSDAGSPRLDVDAYASIDNASAKAAAGILGVSLTGSSLDLKAHFVGTVSDPNNDGKLFFDETASGDGELAQDGSLEGLFSVDFDQDGSLPIDNSNPGTKGSATATFQLGAAPAAEGLSLPSDITATVTVSWPDISTGSPTITAPGLADTIGKFQNMSLKDLAEGLAQVIASITAIQKARFGSPEIGDLDLPFMRGKLSDAIQVADKLKEFLAANTIPAPGLPGFVEGVTDPAQAGQPTFTSLQDLLKKLKEHAGIDLPDLDWDTATSKLSLALTMTKAAPASALNLDELSIEASGTGATYGPKTLTVTGANWAANQWLGRRVVAGTSAGEVASNTEDTITLKTDWIGGQPSDTTPFVISGAEAHAGAVSFANQLQQGGKGIVNANAAQTFAKVTPSFTAAITLVLDLQDPKTGTDCIGFLGSTQACPFTKTDGPFSTHIESLPLNTDRMMIRTGSSLFDADFPIETKVDLNANAGFFKVRMQGELTVCNSSLADTCPDAAGSGHMLSVGLKQRGDAQHDLRISELFGTLVDDPAGLLDVDVNVRAYADVTVSLPGAEDFLPGGASAKFTAKWADLTDPSTITLDTSDLAEIFSLDFDASDPKALFTLLIKTLQTVSSQLASADTSAGSGVFNTEIPGLGRSLRDLLLADESNSGAGVSYGAKTITDSTRSSTNNPFTSTLVGRTVVVGTQVGVIESVSANGRTLTMRKNWESQPAAGTAYGMRSALDDATDRLLATPPDNIQDAVALLNDVLGTESVQFRYLETSGTPNLVLDVDWQRQYRVASPIKLSLGTIGGSQRTFAGAEATGLAQVEVGGNVKLGLVIPLVAGDGPADGAALKVLEDSAISVGAKATLANGVVRGVVGPLSISLGNPASGAPNSEKAQAKADLSVALAKAGAAPNTPVSFNDFIGAVGVNFNATSGTVDCGEELSTDLMVCAKLPLFLNNTGGANDWQSIGDIALRLPKSTNPADLFNLSGNLPAPDDAKKKLELPADFAQKLAEAILDFGNLGDGLEAYLAKIEQAFRLAAFDGKLPLIGEDLQKGADFIGDLRSTLRESIWNELPGAGRPANATEFKNFINAKLADALAEVDIVALNVAVDFDCTETLKRVPGTPQVNPTLAPPPGGDPPPPPPPTGTWEYRIVAFQGSGSGKAGDTIPSNIGSASNHLTLNAQSFNSVSWNSVQHASGYKVLRKGPSDTEFRLRATLSGGNTTSYKDEGMATTAYGSLVTTEPKLDPCPLDFIDGVFLTFDASRGQVSAAKGCEDDGANTCIGGSTPLDIGIPGLALRQGEDGTDGISYDIGFSLHFKLGLNKTDGFFVATHDGWGPDNKARPELQIGLAFDLPDEMIAELAFIKINVNKATGAGHDPTLPLFAGAFQLDLKSTPGAASCFLGTEAACASNDDAKLTFADLGKSASSLFGISLTGQFHIDWIVQAEVDSAFPGVRANFQLDWGFDNNAPQAFGAPTIAFKDIGISAGSFFEEVLGEAITMMKKVTGPIQPVVDTLYAPIPVLSDLSRLAGGDDVTLITLAKTFSTLAGGPKLDFVDTIKAVIEFINRLPSCDEGANDCFVPLGAFDIDGGKALTTSNSPTTADKMFKTLSPQTGTAVKNALNAKNDNPAASGKPVFGSGGNDGDVEKSGFTFPILDNPAEAFTLLMGGDVTLVEFDSGPLAIGFSWRQDFGPVYAPPPVFVTLSGSAEASLRIVAGLDTYGLRKAVEAVRAGTKVSALEVIDGLFFKTVDNNGAPIPVVTLTGEIAAGAAVSAVIITVGIEGGLRLTIKFFWNDPNNDGKFRVSEFGHVALNNPVCLFTMSGKLSLFLRVYITLGVSIFSVSFSFTLADVTLLDFSVTPDCDPPPPKLGGTVGDTLVVYAGKLGGTEFRGHSAWRNNHDDYEEDVVKVIQLNYAQKPGDLAGENADFDGFAIEMLGERREYLDPNLKRVVVDGSGYNKPMKVTFVADGKKSTSGDAGDDPGVFDRDAVVIGGDADDVISTGAGLSYVDGKGGDDTIVTADLGGSSSRAWVAGGAGSDTISVGNGNNRVAGDASLGSATRAATVTHNAEDGGATKDVTVIDWANLADPTTQGGGSNQGNDTINVGLGANKVRGNGGDDTISVATDAPDGSKKAGNNTLIGDAGSDRITGGTGNDRIFTAAEVEFGVDEAGPADAGSTNIVDTGEGNDQVWGSTGVDLVTSRSKSNQKAVIRGGSGNDVLIGGYGTDEIYGGPGHDYVIAEPAEVGDAGADEIINGKNYGPKRTVTKLPLPDGVSPNQKILVGGLGNDHIIGGDGGATIFGDKRIDAEKCTAGDPVTSDPVDESTTAADGDGNDLILGGAGVDIVSAGGGDDIAYGFGGDDLLCGQHGADTLYGGSGADHVWGGSGADVIYGDAGADFLFGNGGNDTMYGGAGNDVIEGNNGNDWISGGAGDDIIYGGTRAAGRPDGSDQLYGDLGEDIIIGDNGTVDDPYPYDLDGETPTAGAGDRIHGGAGNDRAYGGLGDDIINGNDGDDYLEGNNGSDTIHGNAGEDVIIGGSSQQASAGVGRPDDGDFLFGDAGADLILGDNAIVTVVDDPVEATRVTRARGFSKLYKVELLDLGLSPASANFGNDYISGGTGDDVLFGQGGHDRIKGDAGDDYAEGGPGIDWIEGNDGDDDLVGGSSTPHSGSGEQTSGQLDDDDAIFGGPGDDVIIGDNGQVLRLLPGDAATTSTVRMSTDAGVQMRGRMIQLYDRRNGADYLSPPPANRFGADRISGGAGVDVIYGQDGDDFLSGGAHDDYIEGNGGNDVIRGDLALDAVSPHTTVEPLADPGWPGSPSTSALLIGASAPHGQDDIIGGSSTQAFRDGDDVLEGNDGDDVLLGDNGALVRTIETVNGVKREKVYTERYPAGAVPPNATKSRIADPDKGPSTRFCTQAQSTCEPVGAFGDDTMFGNDGDDGMWGQDGDDTMFGGAGDDEMYGELGDDVMFGGSGDDVMLGDRGGVVIRHLNEGDSPQAFTVTLKSVPQESFTAFHRGTVPNTRDSGMHKRVDLLHDVNGNVFVGGPTSPPMPHAGLTVGGNDRMRGGAGNDQLHGGFGDDLMNGDSGGDVLFGGDGNDVMWGGRGCDPALDATTPDCHTGGVFDPHARGDNDRFVDHLFGGQGDDIMDYNPRGSYPDNCAVGTVPAPGDGGQTVDPCVWFEMTNKDDGVLATNQHHHGTDWMYGGWDRDIMQGNVSDNGPNPGDRMVDWTGVYNLYTHCNAAYGGHNDIRQLSPHMHEFLTKLAWADGAGQTAADVTTAGTSAYRELAFTYQKDFKDHGNGPAFPTTPGHFDQPNACEE